MYSKKRYLYLSLILFLNVDAKNAPVLFFGYNSLGEFYLFNCCCKMYTVTEYAFIVLIVSIISA